MNKTLPHAPLFLRELRAVLIAAFVAVLLLGLAGVIDLSATFGASLLLLGPALTAEDDEAIAGDEKKYRTHTLGLVRSMKEEITAQPDRWSAETKKAFEDLDKQIKSSVSTVEEKVVGLQKAQLAIGLEQRMAIGDPVKRLLGNEEVRAAVNAIVRRGLQGTLTDAHKKALGEDTSPGSTLLRDGIASAIYDALPGFGIWNTLAVEPMGSKLENLPIDTADPIAYVILTEGSDIPDDTNITGATVTLTAKLIAVLLNVSRQLLDDAEYDVSARVMMKFLRAIAYRMDFLAFRSDGTSDAANGGFTGVFNFAQVATAASTHTTTEALSFEDVTAVTLATDVAVLTRSPRWWMHPYILTRMLSIKDSNGRPIFLTALEAPTPGALGSILGYPVTLGNVLPTTNTAGSKIAAFGDPDAYVVGLRKDIEFDFSDHAKWAAYSRSFRGVARAGFRGRKSTALTVLKTAAS